LQYAVLSGILAAAYLGSVLVLQTLFGSWADSSVWVALSTLIAAALFSPLRRRLQYLIDRRLFRTRYNLEQVVARFAARSQNEASPEAWSGDLLAAVSETMQPQFSRLWIKGTGGQSTVEV
jgi:hypothetical protein